MFAVRGFFLKCNTVHLLVMDRRIMVVEGELDNKLLEDDGSVHFLLMGVVDESWKEWMMFIFRTSDIAITATETTDVFIEGIIVDY